MSSATIERLKELQQQQAEREPRVQQIKTFLETIWTSGRGEIRILGVNGRPKASASGYFDDLQKAAEQAFRYDTAATPPSGVYVTVNEIPEALLSRAANRIKESPATTTGDAEITRICWLYVDFDPVRPAGIAATDFESENTREAAEYVESQLRDRYGWPEPILGMSGNGYMLLFRVDLPNDDDSTVLRKRVLAGIGQLLGNQSLPPDKKVHPVNVDQTVFNAARIVRLLGTTNRKGDATPDRPHRLSELLYVPDSIEIVPAEKLELVAELAPKPEAPRTPSNSSDRRRSSGGRPVSIPRLDIAAWLTARGQGFSKKSKAGGFDVYILDQCPFSSDHGSHGEVAIHQQASGRLSAECKHNSCAGRRWDDFRKAIGPPGEEHWERASGESQSKPPGSESHRSPDLSAEPADDPPARSIELIDSGEFMSTNYGQKYLCKKILVAGQPGIIGGPAKGMKTSLLLDLGLSLGTATPFLNFEDFACEERKHVAICSGESGPFVIQETIRRIAKSRGVDPASAAIDWGFVLPKLAAADDLQALADLIHVRGIEVLFIDPAYLSLMAGDAAGRQSSNVFDMGSLLLPLSEIGHATGCTIVLIHHFKKGVVEPYGQPELEDLSMSGFLEWGRQWALVRRREPHEDGSGQHRLWLRSGGSAGFSGLWAIDIDEGELRDDFTGRRWNVSVNTARAAKVEQQQQRERRKAEQQEKREGEQLEKLIQAMRSRPEGETKRELRDLAGLSTQDVTRGLETLLKERRVLPCKIRKTRGEYEGFRLATQESKT